MRRSVGWTRRSGRTVIPVNEGPLETPQPTSEEDDVSRPAPEPRHRIRLPRFIVQEGVGLGDVIKRGTRHWGCVRVVAARARRTAQSLGRLRAPALTE